MSERLEGKKRGDQLSRGMDIENWREYQMEPWIPSALGNRVLTGKDSLGIIRGQQGWDLTQASRERTGGEWMPGELSVDEEVQRRGQ